jgi:hypothetical protein
MRQGIARRTRWRAGPAASRNDEQRGKLAARGVEWAGPSRRARAIAVLIAIAIAALIFAVVSRVWRQAAPPPRPLVVEVKLVPTPSPALAPPLPAR